MKKFIRVLVVACCLTLGTFALSATPFAPSTPKAEAVSWTNCYWNMFDGYQWCYKRCTVWEQYVLREPNCQSWVRYSTIWA